MKMPREITAAVLWVAALALMGFGTLDTERLGHNSAFLAWGVFLAVVALVPTGWCILASVQEDHAVDVEQIIGIVDALHEAKRDIHSV
jgi:hypothetical protein